jgi:hypothetical protein
VIQDRSPLYDSFPSISEIDDVQNGVLLRKDLHAMLAQGVIAFLKVRDFARQFIFRHL